MDAERMCAIPKGYRKPDPRPKIRRRCTGVGSLIKEHYFETVDPIRNHHCPECTAKAAEMTYLDIPVHKVLKDYH